jgi:hypothetical protein
MLAVSLSVLLAASVPVSTVSPFAGSWLLSREESTNASEGMAPRITVRTDAKRLIVEYVKEGAAPDVSEYKLDGGKTKKKKTEMDGLMTITQEWSLSATGDGRLVLLDSLAVVGSSRGNVTLKIDTPPTSWKDVWELLDEGRTLRITRERIGGQPTEGGEPTLILHREKEQG